MRLITRCLKPTPLHWLPALSSITPPHLRHTHHLYAEIEKALRRPELPINRDLASFKWTRLKSRNPPALQAHQPHSNLNTNEAWVKEWSARCIPPELFELNPHSRRPGFKEKRPIWCMLNHLSTGVGHCNQLRKRWGWTENESCECGWPEQTVRHIVMECPLTKFAGQMEDLKNVTEEAIDYFTNCKFKL